MQTALCSSLNQWALHKHVGRCGTKLNTPRVLQAARLIIPSRVGIMSNMNRLSTAQRAICFCA